MTDVITWEWRQRRNELKELFGVEHVVRWITKKGQKEDLLVGQEGDAWVRLGTIWIKKLKLTGKLMHETDRTIGNSRGIQDSLGDVMPEKKNFPRQNTICKMSAGSTRDARFINQTVNNYATSFILTNNRIYNWKVHLYVFMNIILYFWTFLEREK